MNKYEILMTIIAAVGAIFGICGIAFPKLKQNGIDTGKVLEKASSGLEVVDKAVDMIKAVAPNIPYINVADMVIDGAQQGVQKAEQLYKADKISAGARKTEAIQLVKDLLTASKVTITPELETIIDGCVEAAVFALPKTTNEISNALTADSASAIGSTVSTSDTQTTSNNISVLGDSVANASSTLASSNAQVTNDIPANNDESTSKEALTNATNTLTAAAEVLNKAAKTIATAAPSLN